MLHLAHSRTMITVMAMADVDDVDTVSHEETFCEQTRARDETEPRRRW